MPLIQPSTPPTTPPEESSSTMHEDMQNLYHELWGTENPFMYEFNVEVPQAGNGIHPGYKNTIRPSAMGTPALAKFLANRTEESFKVIKVKAGLPCGVTELLVRPEYEKIYHHLIRAEAARWAGAGQRGWNPGGRALLDFELSGQPGSGTLLLNPCLSVY